MTRIQRLCVRAGNALIDNHLLSTKFLLIFINILPMGGVEVLQQITTDQSERAKQRHIDSLRSWSASIDRQLTDLAPDDPSIPNYQKLSKLTDAVATSLENGEKNVFLLHSLQNFPLEKLVPEPSRVLPEHLHRTYRFFFWLFLGAGVICFGIGASLTHTLLAHPKMLNIPVAIVMTAFSYGMGVVWLFISWKTYQRLSKKANG